MGVGLEADGKIAAMFQLSTAAAIFPTSNLVSASNEEIDDQKSAHKRWRWPGKTLFFPKEREKCSCQGKEFPFMREIPSDRLCGPTISLEAAKLGSQVCPLGICPQPAFGFICNYLAGCEQDS